MEQNWCHAVLLKVLVDEIWGNQIRGWGNASGASDLPGQSCVRGRVVDGGVGRRQVRKGERAGRRRVSGEQAAGERLAIMRVSGA